MSLEQLKRKHPKLMRQLSIEAHDKAIDFIYRDPVSLEFVKDLYFERLATERVRSGLVTF
jgi:hypothetical protein